MTSVTPTSFVEQGGASTVLAIAEQANIPLARTQRELIPFQRMVLAKEMQRQQDEAEQGAGGGPPASAGGQLPNNASQPGGGTASGETVTYINESA